MINILTSIFKAVDSFFDSVDEARKLQQQMAEKYKHISHL